MFAIEPVDAKGKDVRLTLRLSEMDAGTVERLKRMTGEKMAAKALMVAAMTYEARFKWRSKRGHHPPNLPRFGD